MTATGATTTFVHARIFTGDSARPFARSVSVRDGIIVAVDGAHEGNIIDMQGRFLCAGLIDAHLHLTLGAATLSQVDLAGCTSRDEFESRIAAHAHALDASGDSNAWLIAFGWNEADWNGHAPEQSWLHSAGNRPAVAWRMDQHACLINLAALQCVDSSDIEGGEIDRDASNAPTGMFREQAAWTRVIPAIPAATLAAKRDALQRACAHLHTLGLVAAGSMEYLCDLEGVFVPLRDELTLRVHATVLDRQWPLDAPPQLPEETSEYFRIIGFKSFADGTLGSRTAWMREPYSDAATDAANPAGIAMEHTRRGDLAQWMRAVQALGLSPSIHCIGDRAAQSVLDACDACCDACCDASCDTCSDARSPRLEHMQTLAREDIPRLAGRFASMQPLHKADDARLAMQRLGAQRIERFFAFRSLLAHGARVAFGSDWPIVSPDPLLGMRAAITGLDLDDRPFATSESITVHDALIAYTRTAAEMLQLKSGIIAVGRHADFTVLDRSPFEIDWTREMPVVIATVIAGRTVYDRDATLSARTMEHTR